MVERPHFLRGVALTWVSGRRELCCVVWGTALTWVCGLGCGFVVVWVGVWLCRCVGWGVALTWVSGRRELCWTLLKYSWLAQFTICRRNTSSNINLNVVSCLCGKTFNSRRLTDVLRVEIPYQSIRGNKSDLISRNVHDVRRGEI